ncbi:hypothetical protein GCM10011506_07000 [Marivirga lumbricoides]|uniref:Uncharacterized protein n=1 Tax=Marivirga lumbricoides TaxID=1046115 RepID=A0ABQ1LHB6_9BACT|nr:hypothetical protein GCM10011506_07000 [Marivirga lumbricoides]
MNWKRNLSTTYVFLSLFFLFSLYRILVSIGSESFITEIIIVTLSLIGMYLHFFYIRNLKLLLEKDAVNEKMIKSHAGAYFGLTIYLVLFLEVIAGAVLVFFQGINNTQFILINAFKAIVLAGLVILLLRSVKMGKRISPEIKETKRVGFFGTWKSAVVLIVLGVLKVLLLGVSNGIGISLIVFGLINLIIYLSKHLER